MSFSESPSTAGVTVSVNGDHYTAAPGATLDDLLGTLQFAPDQFATAVNGEFVARTRRCQRVLCEGDRITCFQAISGG